MELCTITTSTAAQPLTLLLHQTHLSTSNRIHFCFTPSLPQPSKYRSVSANSGVTRCYKEERASLKTFEDVPTLEKNSYNESTSTVPTDVSDDEYTVSGQSKGLEILDKLNIQLDSTDTSSILLFGGGGLVALWFASVIVGSIDSIPLFPKLMEVVGLSYTLWFSTRYLLFKKNRDELVTKFEEIKQQVLGSIEE